MTVIIDGGGLPSANYGTITIEKAAGLGATLGGSAAGTASIAAVGVRITGTLLTDKTLLPSWVLLKEIYVEEPSDRTAICKLTGTDPPATIDELYNSAAFAKVLDNHFACPRVVQDDAGECSEIEAKAYARQLLQNALKLANRRQYKINAGMPDTLPEKGQTVRMPDGFEGVVLGYTYSVANNAETLVLDLCNFNAVGY
jgi:hypothetical protein